MRLGYFCSWSPKTEVKAKAHPLYMWEAWYICNPSARHQIETKFRGDGLTLELQVLDHSVTALNSYPLDLQPLCLVLLELSLEFRVLPFV